MYFLLARIVPRFEYLRYGIALVLAFIGAKMLAADLYEVPIAVSLAVVAGTIALAVVASMLWGSKRPAVPDEQ
jgi:tellurite resistance protein TerC